MSITTIKPNSCSFSQKGFSLIEISIVLVILGLITGGIMGPLSAQIERSRRNETKQSLNKALESIYGFALATGHLPCPDTSGDGSENRNAANQCTSSVGSLPWVTLSVGGNDAWGQILTYRVTSLFADLADGTGCATPTTGVSFSLCSVGDILINNPMTGTPVAINIPAIIFSGGKNWPNPPSAHENENLDNDTLFNDRPYSAAAGIVFDDIVTWVVPGVLLNRMVKAGRLP